MSEAVLPKKLLFWRFHLSSAVLAMFLAGGLMYFNFTCRPDVYAKAFTKLEYDATLPFHGGKLGKDVKVYRVRGWPFIHQMEEMPPPSAAPANVVWLDGEALLFGQVFDIPFCAFLTLLGASICSWLVRRREAHEP